MRTHLDPHFRFIRRPLFSISSGLALGAVVFGLILHRRTQGYHEHLDYAIHLAAAEHILLEIELDPIGHWRGLEAEFGDPASSSVTGSRRASPENPEAIRFIVTEAVIASLREDLATMRPEHGARSLYERTILLAKALQERDFERLEEETENPTAASFPQADLAQSSTLDRDPPRRRRTQTSHP